MSYSFEVHPRCLDEIKKLCKKNHALEEALRKKINEILENPQHYKPLRYDSAGEKRVHVMKSFVLKFKIEENKHLVKFISFCHHDEAYRR